MPEGLAYAGRRLRIEFAILRDGSIPGLEFLVGLDARWQAQMHVLFQRLGDEGRISNTEKFKRIEGTEFFEFKAHQIRMPCYYRPDGRVVITHGFVKKGDRIRKGELERARNIKSAYEEILEKQQQER
jgi:phage-related protein